MTKFFGLSVGATPGERKLAFLLFSYFFLITCPHTIIKALRTTDLLVKVGTGALPIAYLSAAVVTGLVVLLQAKRQVKSPLPPLIIFSLGFFALSGALLQILFMTELGRRSAFLPYVFWVWASLLIVVLMTHFWMTVNSLLNPREAKRLIGFIGGGGILGGVVGGSLAGFLTRLGLATLLLPLACVLLGACILVVRAIFPVGARVSSIGVAGTAGKESQGRPKSGLKDSFEAVRRNSYLTHIAAIVALGIIVSTLIEFQFFSTATEYFARRPQELQAFFGFFFAGLTVFAFILNVLLTPKVLQVLKMELAPLVAPVFLALESILVLLFPFSLYPAMVLKGSDESLAFSLNQSFREFLYIPIPPALKLRAKPFIDMFISRSAKVLAALVLLVFALSLKKEVEGFTPIFDPGLAQNLSWVILVFLTLWAVVGFRTGKKYIHAVGEKIKLISNRVDQDLKDKAKVDFAKILLDFIDSQERSQALSDMYLYEILEQGHLTPGVIEELSGSVTRSSFAGLFDAAGAEDSLKSNGDPGWKELVDEISEITSDQNYRNVMDHYAEDIFREAVKTELGKIVLAKMVGFQNPDSALAGKLGLLISDDSPEVSRHATNSAARILKEEYIPFIIEKLGDPLVRMEAANALEKYGHLAASSLAGCLIEGGIAPETKIAAVDVLARIGTQETFRILSQELERAEGDLERDIIDALDRIRSEKTDIRIPRRRIERKIDLLIRRYCHEFLGIHDPKAGGHDEDRGRGMNRGLETALDDIFKLLGLLYPRLDIRKAWQNLGTQNPESVAYALESLDNILKKDMRDAVLPLVEDMSLSERRQRFRKILKKSSTVP